MTKIIKQYGGKTLIDTDQMRYGTEKVRTWYGTDTMTVAPAVKAVRLKNGKRYGHYAVRLGQGTDSVRTRHGHGTDTARTRYGHSTDTVRTPEPILNSGKYIKYN